MRGCLFVVTFAVVFVLAVVWFAGPTIAATLVLGGLSAGGFTADTRSVTVEADPPLELLVGHADAVRIDATGATLGGIHAAKLRASLADVAILDRRFARIEAHLVDASVPGAPKDLLLAAIDLSGPAHVAAARVAIPAIEVSALVTEEVRKAVGVAPSRVTVSAPDLVTIEFLGQSLATALAIDDAGRLVLEPAGFAIAKVVVFDPSSVPGLRLSGVSVAGPDVVVRGTADVTQILP